MKPEKLSPHLYPRQRILKSPVNLVAGDAFYVSPNLTAKAIFYSSKLARHMKQNEDGSFIDGFLSLASLFDYFGYCSLRGADDIIPVSSVYALQGDVTEVSEGDQELKLLYDKNNPNFTALGAQQIPVETLLSDGYSTLTVLNLNDPVDNLIIYLVVLDRSVGSLITFTNGTLVAAVDTFESIVFKVSEAQGWRLDTSAGCLLYYVS